jgi:hypothetical protein
MTTTTAQKGTPRQTHGAPPQASITHLQLLPSANSHSATAFASQLKPEVGAGCSAQGLAPSLLLGAEIGQFIPSGPRAERQALRTPPKVPIRE